MLGKHVAAAIDIGMAAGRHDAALLQLVEHRVQGHVGMGGSIGFADPEREVAFAFVTNSLGPYVLMDPRAQKLARQLGTLL